MPRPARPRKIKKIVMISSSTKGKKLHKLGERRTNILDQSYQKGATPEQIAEFFTTHMQAQHRRRRPERLKGGVQIDQWTHGD
jgi:hypothetical protein